MRKIIFSMMLLWISGTVLGQRMDWDVHPSYPGVTYMDDTKLTYNSPGGVLRITYEVDTLSNPHRLSFDAVITPRSGEVIDYVEIGGIAENTPTIGQDESLWWYYLTSPFPAGAIYLSDSYELDMTKPTSIFIGADASTNYGFIGTFFGAMYYPY